MGKDDVILMGGLHIEMAMLKLICDWLDGSGWTYVMTSANVTTEGRSVCRKVHTHPDVNGLIKLQQQPCSFSFTGRMLTMNSTHQTIATTL